MNPLLISFVEFLFRIVQTYFIAGFIFSLFLLIFALQKVDDSAGWQLGFINLIEGIIFRLLILPGMCFFWPMFLIRLIRGKTKPTESNSHRLLAKRHYS